MIANDSAWQFWIDRGGTFTDIVGKAPDGRLSTAKLLSDGGVHYSDAAIEGIRRILGAATCSGQRIAAVKMGTTVATNALLERKGEPTVLITTRGLGDATRIGTQQRPDIFALDIIQPEMLYSDVIEVTERVSAHGEVVVALDEQQLRRDLARIRASGIESAAIVFLHGYRFTAHERRAAEIAADVGFSHLSVSHEVSPLIQIVPRADTTLVDAYLSPVIDRYVATVRQGLTEFGSEPELMFMQSHGGLVDAGLFHGKDSVLSGPAGGVVGMARTAAKAGFDRVIGFDMGGTSTDVTLFDGAYERTSSTTIAGVRITAPMMRIHTVAAGGGSIVRFAMGRLQVGPESAGANPGPACYRNGGPLTITDANVLLGRIPLDRFPRVFGPDADEPIDTGVVRSRFAELAESVSARSAATVDAEELAAGSLRIAVERMATAIKQISVQQGHDLDDFALCCFGGAGGQHACLVAEALGIRTILVHPLAGVLSAYGMGLADQRIVKHATIEATLDESAIAAVAAAAARLERQALGEIEQQRAQPARTRTEIRVNLKTIGSDTALPIACTVPLIIDRLTADFRRAHERHYGFDVGTESVSIDSVEIEVIGDMAEPSEAVTPMGERAPAPRSRQRVWIAGAWRELPVYDRIDLGTETQLTGPAIIVEDNATTVIEDGWDARVDVLGFLRLSRAGAEPRSRRTKPTVSRNTRDPDPILLEVFNNLFMHVAEQMGIVLGNTAYSVNIKERLDFSCAIFDAAGDLIANAPHVPVHLGSMGDSVRHTLEANRGSMRAGDVYMTNAPYLGGTHLPDITVITPVFGEREQLEFLLASRAHHADIGGISPGSMPPLSRTIDEEGIVFDNVVLVRSGQFHGSEVESLLRSGTYPARKPGQNIADLKAQIAANARGIAELDRLVGRFGRDTVHEYMKHIKTNAERCVRSSISRLHPGSWVAELDAGERICVAIDIDRDARSAIIDFTGSSPTSQGNFNAPSAVARSVVLYVFRTLVSEDIPLNAGCLAPLTLRLPENSIVNPRYPAAVVAGNVETSQCIADALFAALGVLASSQGTMNNFTFGNDRYQYYETLCGGAGASFERNGATAVHTHMTNSKLTDPEILEWRYPVRLRRFEIRRGSGGSGRRTGGDGIVRDIEFLEPMRAGILSNRRRTAPFGISGGGSGESGKNYVVRADGRIQSLAAVDETDMETGDRFVIETPGGGGFGKAVS